MSQLLLFVLLASVAVPAQTPRAESPVVKVALPVGNSAWVVRVVTTGGLTGGGEGDWAISSNGDVICTLVRCPMNFAVSEFRTLVEMLSTLKLPSASPATKTICRDCISRTLTIQHRDETGVIHTFSTSWDDTTRDKIPSQLLRVYDAVLAARDAK
jgi:hypothetical protein